MAVLLEQNFDCCLFENLMNMGSSESKHFAIVVKNIFKSKNPVLSQIVHEAISNHICGLKDIKFWGSFQTFIVLDNHRSMHFRDALPPLKLTENLFTSDRLLFRSKGPKFNILNLLGNKHGSI
ncbi:hypothetical protein PsalMR5_00655 [Piscirickettsia salmonis]|uniref:hypothetical protein n=1 Tax=Piscirickettsia salmonis TaxID=1238 RepID=UPI0012BA5CDB|nr:hypothetical protein [Piscirickettsia salmonis]QGP53250.1 hypothetical protein PsalSR1_00656 [Piscirickettsia salmonis]QGP60830.1 hypothetical protein PsalBI1_03452 [Piscirickettsia salmonis]QGP62816.1 hypothetical protein PsalMR5_00655 [Piscirickettsia salmonis]